MRSQVGTVLQNSAIFSGTLYDNILCGGSFSSDELENALRLSTFEKELVKFPMGLDTILPSGGGILCGGQRQLLLLTRAFLHNPKILILDEASSFLDNKTQDQIMKNLEGFNTTRIFVAHRLSTVRHADKIFVIEKGKVIDQGTYEELASREVLFKDMLEKQKW